MLPLALTGSRASAFFLKPDTRREWASSKELLALHQSNWGFYGKSGRPVVDPFSKENTHCKLQVRERNTSKFLWETPTFPFENLWVSPDSAFIVGIASHARLPHHLVIYRRDGTRALALNAETDMPMLKWRRHVVQNVRWYDFRKPAPSIIREEGDVYLELRTRTWPDAGTIDFDVVRIKIPMITGS